jgi:hypothetical protein
VARESRRLQNNLFAFWSFEGISCRYSLSKHARHCLAVYLFTYHAYRSWNADHRRGYTSKEEGVLPPDQQQAEFYDRNAKQPAVEFDRVMQAVLIAGAADVCRHRDWRN